MKMIYRALFQLFQRWAKHGVLIIYNIIYIIIYISTPWSKPNFVLKLRKRILNSSLKCITNCWFFTDLDVFSSSTKSTELIKKHVCFTHKVQEYWYILWYTRTICRDHHTGPPLLKKRHSPKDPERTGPFRVSHRPFGSCFT